MKPPAPPRLSGANLAAVSGAQRRRLIEAAGRERKAAERAEVAAGVDETVGLGEARGEAFTRATGTGAVRRMTGLGWLAMQGKLTNAQAAAGLCYGRDWRMVMADAGAIRSGLGDHTPGGAGPTLASIMARGNARAAAAERLARADAAIGGQQDLRAALFDVCGREMTPREAGGNAAGSAVITSLVVVALDLLIAAKEA